MKEAGEVYNLSLGSWMNFTECCVHCPNLSVPGVVCQLRRLVPHDGGDGEEDREQHRLHRGVLRGPEQPGLEFEVDVSDVKK